MGRDVNSQNEVSPDLFLEITCLIPRVAQFVQGLLLACGVCSHVNIRGSQLMVKNYQNCFAWRMNNMDDVEYCRLRAQECRRLLSMPQSEARAQLLRNLCQSWVRLANQAELYRDIVRHENRSANNKAALVGSLA
jgi:hypothetical protein